MISRLIYFYSRRSYCSVSKFSNEIANAKKFSEMPTLSIFKAIKFLPGGKYHRKTFKETLDLMNKDYGSIVRIPAMFTKPQFVITYNPDDFEKVFRAEGNWPVRYGLETLEYYRLVKRTDIYGDLGSVFVSHGEKWANLRSITNPILMNPKTIKGYLTQIDEIAKEFVDIMKKIRNEKSEMPENFTTFVKKWSLESVSAIGFERRLNIFNENTKNEEAINLMKDVEFTIEQSVKYDMGLLIFKYYQTKEFKKVLDSSDRFTNIVMQYIDLGIKEINENNLSSNSTEESVLRKLLAIDRRVAVIIVIDMIIAGIETTSSAAINTLYCLAKNPDKQEILRQEVTKILPEKNSQLTSENLRNIPYLKAVIKETFRYYPIVQGNSRMVTKDVELSGYHVPANTHVLVQPFKALQNEKYFPDPQKFLPERWLREQVEGCPKSKALNPFIFLPFGYGVRSCIGKRMAELALEVVLANIIRNFKVEWHHPEMKIKSTFVNIPDSEMRFKMIDV